jgi:tetratricopeptide (TPR) repeat protein
MWFASKEEEVQRLHAEGLACLEAGDFDGAIARGEALCRMRWSGGFELVALGRRGKGDRAGALAALEEAGKVAPGAWMLAQLRGNVLDELGRGADAVLAYDEALAVEGSWRGSIRYNRAVTLSKLGRWGDALADAEAALEDSRGAPFTLDALSLATDALGKLGRHDDAVSLVEHVASAGEDAARELLDLRVGVLRRAGRDAASVRAACERAIEAGGARIEVARALASLASSLAEVGPRSRFRIVARGAVADGGGFFRPATVRARDEADALALVAALEPAAARASLEIESIERLSEEHGASEVLHVAGRIFFGPDDVGRESEP